MTRFDWEFMAEKTMTEYQLKLLQSQGATIEVLQNEVARLRNTLSFYASGTCVQDWNEIGMEDNFGHKARETLKS